jgi:hypothetical protein
MGLFVRVPVAYPMLRVTAFLPQFRPFECLKLAGKRLIGLPIPDIQLENRRGVGKGRL